MEYFQQQQQKAWNRFRGEKKKKKKPLLQAEIDFLKCRKIRKTLSWGEHLRNKQTKKKQVQVEANERKY